MKNNHTIICHNHYILDHLTIYKYRFKSSTNTFKNQSGREFNALCFIISGGVRFCQANGLEFGAAAGDIVYLPKGLAYTSFWSGQPQIEYYTIDFAFSRKTIQVETPKMTISQVREDVFSQNPQVINHDQVSAPLKMYFTTILTAYLSGSTSGSLLAISDFYRLWQMILALMSSTDQTVPTSVHMSLVFPAIQQIEQNYLQAIKVSELAKLCGISESRFFRLFKACTGTSPIDYRNRLRIRYAVHLLHSGQYSVAMVSELLNFANPSYFRQIFRQYAGANPKDYLKINPEQPITFQI